MNAACHVCVRSPSAGCWGQGEQHASVTPSRTYPFSSDQGSQTRLGLTSTWLSDRPGTSSADVLCFGEPSFLLLERCWIVWESHSQTGCLHLLCCSEQPVAAVTEPHAGAWSFQKSEPATALPLHKRHCKPCLPAPSELADPLLPSCMHTAQHCNQSASYINLQPSSAISNAAMLWAFVISQVLAAGSRPTPCIGDTIQ